MRTCLFLSSAIALVALVATTAADANIPSATKVSSYTVPNDENNAHGYFTLIDRETKYDGSRVCSILDRGETKVFRNLWPANRSGDRFQVLRRNVHDESHGHHGRSQSNEETFDIAKEVNDLFELNTNSKDWELMEGTFLEGECDQVKDETINNSASVDGFLGLARGPESSQGVLDAASGLQEADEVVRNEQHLWEFFSTKRETLSTIKCMKKNQRFVTFFEHGIFFLYFSANSSTMDLTETASTLCSWAMVTLSKNGKSSLLTCSVSSMVCLPSLSPFGTRQVTAQTN